jgi:hypothetical protein
MHTHSIYIGQIAFARALTLRTLAASSSQTSTSHHSCRQHLLPALLSYLRRRFRRQPQP